MVGGIKDLAILKSTGSEFAGFYDDRYTVLEPTLDRVMATSLTAQWRFAQTDGAWNIAWDDVTQASRSSWSNSSRWCSRRRSATDAFRDGQGGARGVPDDRRGAAVRTRTSTTLSTTFRRSGWRTTRRSSTPTTGRTASFRPPSPATTRRRRDRLGRLPGLVELGQAPDDAGVLGAHRLEVLEHLGARDGRGSRTGDRQVLRPVPEPAATAPSTKPSTRIGIPPSRFVHLFSEASVT